MRSAALASPPNYLLATGRPTAILTGFEVASRWVALPPSVAVTELMPPFNREPSTLSEQLSPVSKQEPRTVPPAVKVTEALVSREVLPGSAAEGVLTVAVRSRRSVGEMVLESAVKVTESDSPNAQFLSR